jgi:hypothetical protein
LIVSVLSATQRGIILQITPKLILKILLLLLLIAVGVYTVGDMLQDFYARHTEEQYKGIPAAVAPAPQTVPPFWQAKHETGDMEEYSWWRMEGASSGTLTVVPDPTGSGRGFVLRGEITSASPPPGDSHRLYPVFMLPECYRGTYSSTFSVWADLPPHSATCGWISFATYSNMMNWKDLYGVNLGHEDGVDRLVLFHVPTFGKGDFTRFASVPFPMKKWVSITVKVDDSGIMLFQDERLVAEAKKSWGAEGVGVCEAHWGLYGQGKTASGVLLNDNVSVTFDGAFTKKTMMVRPDNHSRRNVNP